MKRPARARERIRLAAALGILAAVAIAAGGLASLASGKPLLPDRAGAKPVTNNLDWVRPIEASTDEPKRAVEQAEAAAAEARAVLERARSQGVDEASLSTYEARLEQLEHGANDKPVATPTPRPAAEISPRQALRPPSANDRGL